MIPPAEGPRGPAPRPFAVPDDGLLRAFSLAGRVAVVTGGAGLLGRQHTAALGEAGACVVVADVDEAGARAQAVALLESGAEAYALGMDVTDPTSVDAGLSRTLERFGRVDVLVNNAARNPKVGGGGLGASRLETFPLEAWELDLAVGLRGAFLCSRAFGAHMAQNGGGTILNVASDLASIAPDQRIYRQQGLSESEQPTKPITYSVVKGGLVAMTRYLATYWAEAGVRVNAISPGGVYQGQPEAFVAKLAQLIPMGRMAREDEYRAAVVFLCSPASSYMTGANLAIDGGRTCW